MKPATIHRAEPHAYVAGMLVSAPRATTREQWRWLHRSVRIVAADAAKLAQQALLDTVLLGRSVMHYGRSPIEDALLPLVNPPVFTP